MQSPVPFGKTMTRRLASALSAVSALVIAGFPSVCPADSTEKTPPVKATTTPDSTPSPSATEKALAAAKASFQVYFATWGATDAVTKKDHAVDVTDRVTDLLLRRDWLRINPAEMGSDPWPGQHKFLFIKYEALGKKAQLVIQENRVLTLNWLLKHAGALPAGIEARSPASLKSITVTEADGTSRGLGYGKHQEQKGDSPVLKQS